MFTQKIVQVDKKLEKNYAKITLVFLFHVFLFASREREES